MWLSNKDLINTHTHTHTHTHTASQHHSAILSLSPSVSFHIHTQSLCALPLWHLIGCLPLRAELLLYSWSWKKWPQMHETTTTHTHSSGSSPAVWKVRENEKDSLKSVCSDVWNSLNWWRGSRWWWSSCCFQAWVADGCFVLLSLLVLDTMRFRSFIGITASLRGHTPASAFQPGKCYDDECLTRYR